MTPTSLDPAACDFLVVEDEALLRDLVELTLRSWFRPRRSAAFASARAALQAIAQGAPDVLVTDLALPDGDGRELIRELRRRGREARIIVLTGRADSTLPAELIALGVAGLVEKSLASVELKTAIERVLSGGLYYSTSFAPKISRVVAVAATPASSDMLTAQEREIARMVASGLSSKEVATRMNLAPRTVEKYRAEIIEKLEVRDFAGLVRWCVQNGLV